MSNSAQRCISTTCCRQLLPGKAAEGRRNTYSEHTELNTFRRGRAPRTCIQTNTPGTLLCSVTQLPPSSTNMWPRSVKSWPTQVKPGQMLTKIGPNRPDLFAMGRGRVRYVAHRAWARALAFARPAVPTLAWMRARWQCWGRLPCFVTGAATSHLNRYAEAHHGPSAQRRTHPSRSACPRSPPRDDGVFNL